MNVITLKDDLTFSTVSQLIAGMPNLLRNSGESCVIDLAQVQRTDSAGLAFLLELLRYAKSQGKTLQFHHLPNQLASLATFTRVDSLLPIALESLNG